MCDLRWIGGRRAYTSDTDGYWLPFSTAAASGRGVGHRPLGMGSVYGTGQLGGGRELLDRTLILNQASPQPDPGTCQISRKPVLSGLINEYERAA